MAGAFALSHPLFRGLAAPCLHSPSPPYHVAQLSHEECRPGRSLVPNKIVRGGVGRCEYLFPLRPLLAERGGPPSALSHPLPPRGSGLRVPETGGRRHQVSFRRLCVTEEVVPAPPGPCFPKIGPGGDPCAGGSVSPGVWEQPRGECGVSRGEGRAPAGGLILRGAGACLQLPARAWRRLEQASVGRGLGGWVSFVRGGGTNFSPPKKRGGVPFSSPAVQMSPRDAA